MRHKSKIWYQEAKGYPGRSSRVLFDRWLSPCRKYRIVKDEICYKILSTQQIPLSEWMKFWRHKDKVEFDNIISLEAAKEIYETFIKQ